MASRMSAGRRELLARRVGAQGLFEPLGAPADAVRHVLAVQAQDWFGSLWAVGARSAATATEVEQAQRDRSIVRSWPMRGTLHWTAAEDIGWLTALTRDRVDRASAARHRELGIDDRVLAIAEATARERLAGGAEADRSELIAAFEEAGLRTHAQRAPHLLGWLATRAIVVMTSRTGYALHDDWVATPRRLDGDEALATLAERYVAGHGPVTHRDLAWWAGITLTDARRALDAVRDRLEPLTLDGVEYVMTPGTEPAPRSALLLAPFDELVLGYGDRGAVLGDEPLERVVPGRNGMFLATLALDGQVAGTWRRTLRAAEVDVELDPWRPIAASRMPSVRGAARAYGRHLGLRAQLS